MATATESSLDVDWLLHSKKDLAQSIGERSDRSKGSQPSNAPQASQPDAQPIQPRQEQTSTPLKEARNGATQSTIQQPKPAVVVNGKENNVQSTPPKTGQPPAQSAQNQPVRPSMLRGQSNENGKKGLKPGTPNKKEGRRSSWISSFSSKFSSSPTPSRNSSVDVPPANNDLTASPQPSPKVELTNPFEKSKPAARDAQKENKKEETKTVVTPLTPRRPSVLVAAGKETKLEHPGFLSSALRRLSSSSNATMGKGAGTGAICPRKVMNVDQNRERIKISEFDQNKLKRVAFCVDVEIAGFASQGDEEAEQPSRPPVSSAQKQNVSTSPDKQVTKDSKSARMTEKGEGAALKNPKSAIEEKEEVEQPKPELKSESSEEKQSDEATEAGESLQGPDTPAAPGTRKKEKKKRSEAERKERKERKRRHAEANGLVPLELTRDDEDSDSIYSSTPPGASTPSRRPVEDADGRTVDPLRIYKRCCQLRETTVLSRVKEQISKPTATLAEAPGTVAVMDLSGFQMQLPDIVTLGDWLAVVPVRKLILDNCNLTDEGVRVILSGLSGCKSAEQARQNRKLPKRLSGKHGKEQMGVIEKLSLKENPGITNVGWRHIALFMHMSRSLRAIDLSGIRFPRSTDLSRTVSATSSNSSGPNGNSNLMDLGSLIIYALSERLGDRLEELILSGCSLSTANVRDLVDCAIKCKIRRLGLAASHLNEEALSQLVRYIKSGHCEGLDLGSNDLHGITHILGEGAGSDCPLFAISLSDCNLTPDDLSSIFIPFSRLKNLKFIDLSRNMALFSSTPGAVPVFRKLLPKLKPLKRIHLSDVGMTSEQAIAIAEILPDCPSMAHVSILDNAPLIYAMNDKAEESQEEACAFFASLMTAVRVSETLVAVEIEVPSADSSEVVKALASQVVAYSLRNMERTTLNEVGIKTEELTEKDAPEVLLHLVGHMEGYTENYDKDESAPDEDYVIASTGIVKALGVCLDRKDGNSRAHSRNISPNASGASTPRGPLRPRTAKPRDVSLELCESARKIRRRLQPVLVREDRAGHHDNYRRLFMLDQTLQRMIKRFEDEYPETKLTSSSPPTANGMPSPDPSMDASMLSASIDSNGGMKSMNADGYFPQAEEAKDDYAAKLTRTSSNTSLAKAITDEEGRMHRFGQSIRREVLKPTEMDDHLHGSHSTDSDPPHLAALRAKLEEMQGEDIRFRVERDGADNVIRQLGINAQELLSLKEEDPEGFEVFKKSQLAAQINAGFMLQEHNGEAKQWPERSSSRHRLQE
ncbi:Microtubules assembly and stabilization protein [Cladophialophora chaetospira]|uniref:Microtubules assembly and stabilization protein n=1 Tax=Cladophialophora chaetospira TaxID=386627 RepID=A0AA38XJF8_9EURO|nr:Microtubules assembly and stabilization protein [Cladophialophora chaetospira]